MTRENTIQRIIDLSDLSKKGAPKFRNYLEGMDDRFLSDRLQTLELERGQVKRGYFTDMQRSGRNELPMRITNMVLGNQRIMI